MAFGHQQIEPTLTTTARSRQTGKSIAALAPLAVAVAILFGIIPLFAFAWERGGSLWPDTYAWRVTRFTLFQALLSTLLSVIPAIFIARAMARRQFKGKALLLTLFAIPQSLPVIIVIFGVAALYGQAGLLGGMFQIYGLNGILLVHVFFNLPLAVRLLYEALEAIPQEQHRLAAQLNFSNVAIFKYVDWPALKATLAQACALIFLLCAASFITVLIFGGPQATTLEVAIYQSLRTDFDVNRALSLSFIQVLLSIVLIISAAKALRPGFVQPTLHISPLRYDRASKLSTVMDMIFILAILVLILPVYAAIVLQGVQGISITRTLFNAFMTSVGTAALSSIATLLIAWGIAKASLHINRLRTFYTLISLGGYVFPPAVIATGWFLVAQRFENSLAVSLGLIATMNMLMSLPFVLAVIMPAMTAAAQQHDRLCMQLNIQGWNRFRTIDVKALRAPLSQSMALVFVLSLGDLTALTLLGSNGLVTLPSLIKQQMGHYNFQAAGGTALLLAALCIAITFSTQRFARWK
jgi:thiamine transport system permease protein